MCRLDSPRFRTRRRFPVGHAAARAPLLYLIIVAALSLCPAPSPAAIVHVPGQQPSIQAGLNAAAHGDTVLVSCGTYYEHNIQMRSGITLQGATGLATCATINAQHLGRVMVCEATDSTTTIEGFTLRGGRLPGCSSGGGVYCSNASPRFRHCVFLDNEECQGGCLYCRDSSPSFSDCVFQDNRGDYHGGAVECMSSSPSFVRCQFIANTAADRGGAVSCNQSSPLFIDCSFESNSASTGGALCCAVVSTPIATRCVFTGNSAFHLGGAVECHAQCTARFEECVFRQNSVTRDGGALAGVASWIEIEACTLYQNAAGYDGAGAYLEDGGVAVLSHTIIAGSTGGQAVFCDDAGCAATASCCDLFGNAGGDWVSCLAGQQGVNGNIDADPLFCEPTAGDLTLHADSPCAIPQSPSGCGLIGALGIGCEASVAVLAASPDAMRRRLHVTPNPVCDASEVILEGEWSGAIQLRCFDTCGRLVLDHAIVAPLAAGGHRRIPWHHLTGPNRLAAGVYYLQARRGGEVQSARVVVLP
jgi:predicted outer membrane repeat protein